MEKKRKFIPNYLSLYISLHEYIFHHKLSRTPHEEQNEAVSPGPL